MTEFKKRGKYGSKETGRDEAYSSKCAEEICDYLKVHYPFKNYHYVLMSNGIEDSLWYERDFGPLPSNFKPSSIEPDIPAILLVNNENPKDFYLVLTGDDKYQKTQGNAIERSNKNHRAVCEEKICHGVEINPYVIMASGPAFMTRDGKYTDYLHNKFRQMMPYLKNGKPYIWEASQPHCLYKNQGWNLLYVKRRRFTKDEKMGIFKDVAIKSVEYYKNFLD